MEPGVRRVMVEPAVMLPLVGAEMSLGKAWVHRVSCHGSRGLVILENIIVYLYGESRIA